MIIYEFEFRQHTIVLILDSFFCHPDKSFAKAVEEELRRCTRPNQAMARIKQRLAHCWFEGYYPSEKPNGGNEYTLVCQDVYKGGSGDWYNWRDECHPIANKPIDIADR